MTESKAVTVQEKNVTDKVLNRIKDLEAQGNISFPKSYSYSNALKSAYLMLSEATDKNGKPVLEVCSQASVINALLDMTIQGLSPAKKQCYFIPYGGKLQLSKSYLGNIAATKRLKGVKDVFANVIYEDDDFEYQFDLEIGVKKITKHEQKIENISLNKIKGAYAIVIREDAPNYVEVMTIEQIRNAWNQGYAKGNSGAHKNFTDEMAKKTVINRACKNFVCTSDDSDLLIDSINRTNEYEPEDIIETTKTEVKEEIKEEANKEFVDVEVQPVHETKEQVQMDMENEVDF
ncbi:recombinase RecT [Clostridium cadaveris]|uniref:recombinase RecT n=1 Tax=Clostridium cadaveris TaxID=1529 RepID=UPI001459787A|nr:RecT family recombinase [Clostridium cadaveris]NME63826.1 recombinase RecT [Clostridium cadaveris]